MLFAFLLTRAGLGHVHLRFGAHEQEQVAILEWMGASPVYTQRMQRTLGFAGDDMATIFKGLQLDVGFTHQYMDVGYKLVDRDHGEFWLNSCGALLDVEPMGEEHVFSMCHHIEDPTFDATAVASNPRARIRPVHRPPRQPAERVPHCYWTVTIDPANEPVVEHELTRRVRESRLADLVIRTPEGRDEGGRADYAGEFDPEFQLEVLGQGALLGALNELVLQSHLLVRSMLLAVDDRQGADAARELAVFMSVGANWIASERLRSFLGLGGGVDAMAAVLALHPAFPPEYAPLGVEVIDGSRLRLLLDPAGPALAEGDDASWFALLADGDLQPLEALVQGVDAHAVVAAVAPLTWDVVVDPDAPAAAEPDAVAITRVGKCAGFTFERRRAVEGAGR